jgi:hypothetical protein
MSVLKYWVAGPWAPIDREVLNEIEDFAKSLGSCPHSAHIADDLAKAVTSKVTPPHLRAGIMISVVRQLGDAVRDSLEASSSTSISIDAMEPLDVANMLAHLQGELFKRLRPADYVISVHGLPIANNIGEASALQDKIAFWVQKSILDAEARGKVEARSEVESRAKVLTLFIVAAQASLAITLSI